MDASQRFDDYGVRHKCDRCRQTYLARYLAGTSNLPPDWEVCPWCQGDKSPYKIEGVTAPLWFFLAMLVVGIVVMVGMAVAMITLRLHSALVRMLFPAMMLGFAAVLCWRLFKTVRFLQRVK